MARRAMVLKKYLADEPVFDGWRAAVASAKNGATGVWFKDQVPWDKMEPWERGSS